MPLKFLLILCLLLPAAAQKNGTCRCCELGRVYAPYLKDLPAPQPRRNIGNSHLKITTGSTEAQRWFDQGLNLLHAFWEFEAYRCFLQAAKADPDCAMAYWGICMSLPGKNIEAAKERSAALKTARTLAASAGEHEKLYIGMVERLIGAGTAAAVPELRKIVRRFPDDVEAAAFLGLWLRDGYDSAGKPKRGTKEAAALLQAALKKHPKHTGLNHYLIHVLEQGPDFEQARAAAVALPKAAPGAGHLVHMPGHIHYLAGEYEKACAAFRACRKVEKAYLAAEKIPAIDNNNHLHNLHFLAYAAADQGKYREALEAARALASVPVPEGRENSQGNSQLHYYGATMPALVHMRFRKFKRAAASLHPEKLPADSGAHHYASFLLSYCRLRQLPVSGREKDGAEYKNLINSMRQALQALEHSKPPASPESDAWGRAHTVCQIMLLDARAWNANTKNTGGTFDTTWPDLAVRTARRAPYTEPPLLVTPVEESMAHLALATGHFPEARRFFLASLKKRRMNGHAFLGLARSHAKENPDQATTLYQSVLDAFKHADPNLPELKEAKQFIQKHPAP